jgi:hypothetical protein
MDDPTTPSRKCYLSFYAERIRPPILSEGYYYI